MKEACGRFSQPARALPISSTQIGNLLVIQSFASTSLWNPEISSKAPSSQVARTAQVSAEDVSECRIWRTGSFVMIALAVNQPPSGPFSPMQLVNARQNIKFGLGHPLLTSNHVLRHARACRGHLRLNGSARTKSWMGGGGGGRRETREINCVQK